MPSDGSYKYLAYNKSTVWNERIKNTHKSFEWLISLKNNYRIKYKTVSSYQAIDIKNIMTYTTYKIKI